MGAGGRFEVTPGRLVRHAQFESRFVESRNIDVWLPPDYDPAGNRTYATVYLHDGQNLFEPSEAFAGIDWGIDESLDLLLRSGQIRDTIAVGIWNTPNRLLRYMPKRPFELIRDSEEADMFARLNKGESPASDSYLDFVVTELKPFIEEEYRVKPEAESTLIMGASMGALVSLYAVCEYPTVFGGAGCLSTSWTVAGDPFVEYLRERLPRAGTHRFYLDYGQEARIEHYQELQDRADRVAESRGYSVSQVKGFESASDWQVRSFPDHDHSERSWRERVAIPLKFLLGQTIDVGGQRSVVGGRSSDVGRRKSEVGGRRSGA